MADRKLRVILEGVDAASPVFAKVRGALTALGGIAAAVGAYQIGRQLVDGLVAATNAAAEAEKVDRQLAQAIRNSGQSVDALLPTLSAQATALQRVTGASDEAIKSGQTLLISIGRLRGEGLERATTAALDFAAATGTDLDSAFRLLAKAAAGNTAALSRYGLVLDEDLPKGEKFAAVLALIAKQFGGAAAANLDTYAGKVQLLRENFNNLQETIGNAVLPVASALISDFLNPLVVEGTDAAASTKGLSLAFLDLADAMVPALRTFEFLLRNLETLNEIRKAGSGDLAAALKIGFTPFEKIFDAGTKSADAFQKKIEELRADLTFVGPRQEKAGPKGGPFVDLGESADKTKTKLDELLAKFREVNEEFARFPAGERAGLFDHGVEGADKLDERTEGVLDRFREMTGEADRFGQWINDAADKSGDLQRNIFDTEFPEDSATRFSSALDKMLDKAERIRAAVLRLTDAIYGGAVNAALAFGDALVDAASGADVSWRQFFAGLLRDFAKAIVSATILNALSGIGGGFGAWFQNVFKASRGGVVPGVDQGRDTVPAMLRPGEVVLSRAQAAAMGQTTPGVNVSFSIDARGSDAGVESRLLALMPRMVEMTKRAVADSVRRGGSYAEAFR